MTRALVRLALTGSLAGCVIAIAGCSWLAIHEEDELAYCDADYDDCLADAWSPEDQAWCVAEVQSCYESCGAGWEEGDSAADEADDRDGEGESGADGADTNPGDGDGDGDVPQACIDLHANCIEQAATLADVEACEALFEQCSNPGECPMCGCPEGELEACLDCYAGCSEAASSEAEIDACAADFDACTAPFADLCEVAENPNLEVCLAQHQLCVACAEGDEQLAACKSVFDSCMIQL
ncbi:hypothetical protein ACNOYE_33255 [Nannocystaceae bacterium ST9]